MFFSIKCQNSNWSRSSPKKIMSHFLSILWDCYCWFTNSDETVGMAKKPAGFCPKLQYLEKYTLQKQAFEKSETQFFQLETVHLCVIRWFVGWNVHLTRASSVSKICEQPVSFAKIPESSKPWKEPQKQHTCKMLQYTEEFMPSVPSRLSHDSHFPSNSSGSTSSRSSTTSRSWISSLSYPDHWTWAAACFSEAWPCSGCNHMQPPECHPSFVRLGANLVKLDLKHPGIWAVGFTDQRSQILQRLHQFQPHRIRVWYFYLYMHHKKQLNVGEYTSPMNGMGLLRMIHGWYRTPLSSPRTPAKYR